MPWCVRRAKRIFVGDVDVDEVWVVFFGVGVIVFAFVPKVFADFFEASPWRP